MAGDPANPSPTDDHDGLNPIPRSIRRIHCAPTDENDNGNELDQIAIDNFLDTLAEVTLAVIRRRQIEQ